MDLVVCFVDLVECASAVVASSVGGMLVDDMLSFVW